MNHKISWYRSVLVVSLMIFFVPESRTATAANGIDDIFDRVKHGYADSAGVKIHYASLGPTTGSTNAPLINFVQNDAAEFVSAMMKAWLEVQASRP